jgi:hypothetical protein
MNIDDEELNIQKIKDENKKLSKKFKKFSRQDYIDAIKSKSENIHLKKLKEFLEK